MKPCVYILPPGFSHSWSLTPPTNLCVCFVPFRLCCKIVYAHYNITKLILPMPDPSYLQYFPSYSSNLHFSCILILSLAYLFWPWINPLPVTGSQLWALIFGQTFIKAAVNCFQLRNVIILCIIQRLVLVH